MEIRQSTRFAKRSCAPRAERRIPWESKAQSVQAGTTAKSICGPSIDDERKAAFDKLDRGLERQQCWRLRALSSREREWRVSAQADVREGASERPCLVETCRKRNATSWDFPASRSRTRERPVTLKQVIRRAAQGLSTMTGFADDPEWLLSVAQIKVADFQMRRHSVPDRPLSVVQSEISCFQMMPVCFPVLDVSE